MTKLTVAKMALGFMESVDNGQIKDAIFLYDSQETLLEELLHELDIDVDQSWPVLKNLLLHIISK